jgi:hypothetical protein
MSEPELTTITVCSALLLSMLAVILAMLIL